MREAPPSSLHSLTRRCRQQQRGDPTFRHRVRFGTSVQQRSHGGRPAPASRPQQGRPRGRLRVRVGPRRHQRLHRRRAPARRRAAEGGGAAGAGEGGVGAAGEEGGEGGHFAAGRGDGERRLALVVERVHLGAGFVHQPSHGVRVAGGRKMQRGAAAAVFDFRGAAAERGGRRFQRVQVAAARGFKQGRHLGAFFERAGCAGLRRRRRRRVGSQCRPLAGRQLGQGHHDGVGVDAPLDGGNVHGGKELQREEGGGVADANREGTARVDRDGRGVPIPEGDAHGDGGAVVGPGGAGREGGGHGLSELGALASRPLRSSRLERAHGQAQIIQRVQGGPRVDAGAAGRPYWGVGRGLIEPCRSFHHRF